MTNKDEIICPWYDKCENAGKKCHKCTLNANLDIGNYLVLRKKDKKISYKYLETE